MFRVPAVSVVAAGLILSLAAAAQAEEVLTTAGAAQPLPPLAETVAPASIPTAPAPAQDPRAQEIGAWAQGVLDGRPSQEEPEARDRAEAPRCPPSDGKPHGQVWAGVGTRGYREIGGVVTQRVGDCGSITVGVSKTEGGYGRRRR